MDIDYMQSQAHINKMTDEMAKYYNHYYEIDVKPDMSLLKEIWSNL